tara:strand:+ start:3192 stop:3740 length:549 start_codon:yes stop_codon:yes gene_type:complete
MGISFTTRDWFEKMRNCVLLKCKGYVFLVYGLTVFKSKYEEIDVLTSKCQDIKYGFTLYGSDSYMFPSEVVADYGKVYSGDDAIRFILDKGITYPRSEVNGTSEEGLSISIWLRDIDLSIPLVICCKDRGNESWEKVDALLIANGYNESNADMDKFNEQLPLVVVEGNLNRDCLVDAISLLN